MSRFKLQIPNRGELLLHDSIEELFRLSKRDLQYRTRGWAEKGIASVILMTTVITRTQEKRVERLQTEIENAGLALQVLSSDAIPGMDVAELARFHRRTLENLERGTSLLFFNKLERKLIERTLATLLLEIDPSLRPEDSITRVAGRRPREPRDDFVYKYKSFVDPEWDLRHGVQDWPVDESVELTTPSMAAPGLGTSSPVTPEVEAGPVEADSAPGARPVATQARDARREKPAPARPARRKAPPASPGAGASGPLPASFFSIRVKLLAAVALALVFFGCGSVYLTYRYFKGENDFLVRWYASGTADSVARRISSELDNLEHTARQLGLDRDPERSEFLIPAPAAKRGVTFAAVIRQENLGVRFEALGVPADEAYEPVASSRTIMKFLQKKESDLLAATRGAMRVLIDDEDHDSSLLVLAAPLSGDPERAIVIAARTAVLFSPPENVERVSLNFVLKEDERTVFLYGRSPRLPTGASLRKMFGDEPAGLLRLFDSSGAEYLTAHRRLAGRPMGVLVSVAARESGALARDYLTRNFPLILILFNFALLFVFFFARKITEPIKALIRALREYHDFGQTHEPLPVRSGDESGQLTHEVRRILALRDARP